MEVGASMNTTSLDWMHQSLAKGSSVSPAAVAYCRQHDISVIAGACPMMYGAGVDFGHTCMRLFMKFGGGLPGEAPPDCCAEHA